MSLLQRVVKTSAIFLKTVTRLAQQLRQKTTSEHVLGLRGGAARAGVPKTPNQLAKECMGHMDFLPIPDGSWEANYRARNAKWTTMLIFATSFLGITIYCMHLNECLYLHSLPSRRKIRPDSDVTGKIMLVDEEQAE